MTTGLAPFDISEALLIQVEGIAEQAGAIILNFYDGDLSARRKSDSSPVTDADEAAERHIVAALRALTPDVPIVSEEADSAGHTPDIGAAGPARRFWLVDPLDGTKEFLSRNGEFTVNIGLIQGSQPILGVVHLPALAATYGGIAGRGAWVQRRGGERHAIAARPTPADGAIVLASRSHGDQQALSGFLGDMVVAERRVAGSALKFCRIAEGIADLYPRLGRTMEWDTAAGHAVLVAAGGSVTTLDGNDLNYGKAGFANPHFVARGRPS